MNWRILLFVCLGQAGLAQAAPAASLDDLLLEVRRSAREAAAVDAQREAEFLARRDQQQQQLAAAREQQKQLETRAEQLEALYHARQEQLAELRGQLDQRLGALRAVLGVVQEVSGETATQLRQSLVSAQYPGRDAFALELAERAASGTHLPSVGDIRRLWLELQQEMTAAAQVTRFQGEVVRLDGELITQEVVRVGPFNLVGEQGYLVYRPDAGRIAEPARQPARRYRTSAEALLTATDEFPVFGVDPARGGMLALLGQVPRPLERVQQGGLIGYLILALGALALLITAERLTTLTRAGAGIRRQLRAETALRDNALGRILSVHESAPDQGLSRLETRLGEAVLREIPPLTRFLPLLRLIAATAPLLGLLGTIVGMIQTFQALTLFGTGDPRLMAGGISQALVTTMLGLGVAIPTLLLHSLVSSRSRSIVHQLEEQTAGLIARRAHEEVQA